MFPQSCCIFLLLLWKGPVLLFSTSSPSQSHLSFICGEVSRCCSGFHLSPTIFQHSLQGHFSNIKVACLKRWWAPDRSIMKSKNHKVIGLWARGNSKRWTGPASSLGNMMLFLLPTSPKSCNITDDSLNPGKRTSLSSKWEFVMDQEFHTPQFSVLSPRRVCLLKSEHCSRCWGGSREQTQTTVLSSWTFCYSQKRLSINKWVNKPYFRKWSMLQRKAK